MLWACIAEGCLHDPSSWRALSCVLPKATEPPKTSPAKPTHIPLSNDQAQEESAQLDWTSPAAGPTDAWGASANDHDWGNASPAPPAAAAAAPSPHGVFDYKDLEAALSSFQQSSNLEAGIARHKKEKLVPASAAWPTECKLSSTVAAKCNKAQLPGFYLNVVPESVAMPGTESAEDQHIAELLARYQSSNPEVNLGV